MKKEKKVFSGESLKVDDWDALILTEGKVVDQRKVLKRRAENRAQIMGQQELHKDETENQILISGDETKALLAVGWKNTPEPTTVAMRWVDISPEILDKIRKYNEPSE